VIDSHCHLDHCEAPASEVIERARASGVTRLATVGIDEGSTDFAIATAREHDGVVAIVGRHPQSATAFGEADAEAVERAAGDPVVRAIGETGLDYYRDYSPRDDQRRAFEAQVDLARRLGLPLVIHTRAAEEDTFDILRDRAGGVTVVLHCFSAPGRLEECVELGYVCSFAGNVTYPKATDLHAAARDVPEELLLVETDSPFLAPQSVRGKPNSPANVVEVAERLAEERGVTYEQLEETVERNAGRVFGW
jgi:TatD DNase family protein